MSPWSFTWTFAERPEHVLAGIHLPSRLCVERVGSALPFVTIGGSRQAFPLAVERHGTSSPSTENPGAFREAKCVIATEFASGLPTRHRCDVPFYSTVKDTLLRVEFEGEPNEQSSVQVELPVLPRPGQLPTGIAISAVAGSGRHGCAGVRHGGRRRSFGEGGPERGPVPSPREARSAWAGTRNRTRPPFVHPQPPPRRMPPRYTVAGSSPSSRSDLEMKWTCGQPGESSASLHTLSMISDCTLIVPSVLRSS